MLVFWTQRPLYRIPLSFLFLFSAFLPSELLLFRQSAAKDMRLFPSFSLVCDRSFSEAPRDPVASSVRRAH